MNLFNIANDKKVVADSKRRGSQAALKTTISIPFFKGVYRVGKENKLYSIKVAPLKGKKKVVVPVKPITGAFIITYFSCLAFDLVQDENRHRAACNFADPLKESALAPFDLTTFFVEALIESEGFTYTDYQQGKTQGATRIGRHITEVSEKNELPITVDDSIIKGITPEIADSVLTSI